MWRLILGLSLSPAFVHAGTLEIKQDGKSIFLEEKSGWKLHKDIFGIPHIYFSPKANGQRTNLSFTDTGAVGEIDLDSLRKSQKVYQQLKENWAIKVGATPNQFLPYEVQSNRNGHKIHQIGFVFNHHGKIYLERSFYIECRGKILFSKSLRLDVNKEHDAEINDILKTLDCSGV
jgi:hypothetical protein